jgi:cystathionine beta-synthase
LNKIAAGLTGNFYAKVEAFNPGHSAKDRIALHIINCAEEKGILKPGATIVETTSGNTGFSLAMISIIMGAKVYVCPANVAADDPRSYYEVAKKIHKETPNSIYINQYFNDLNIEAHYCSTGKEIWNQTNGSVTHVVVCSGTGGTISGIGRYLKEKNPSIKVLGVDAYGSVLKKYHETKEFDEKEIYSYKIEGLGKNLIPTATDFDIIDQYVKVTDKESAITAREISKTEGLFVGYTSGAAFQAVKQYAASGEFNENSNVVVVFPDHGSRYMSKIYSDEWMQEQGFLDAENSDDSMKIEVI